MKLADRLKDAGLLHAQGYVNGRWVDANDGGCFDVTDPADGSVLASVADMGRAETLQAVAAAQASWADWRALTGKARGGILRRWYELILENQADLAAIMTAEQGKPLAESAGEIVYGASFVEWFAEEAKRIYGDVVPHHADGKRILVLKQPVGVVGAITPWNFPNAMITRKCAPALAVGCPVVIKPSELTPLSALALAELAHRAGIPEGVFNVVVGTDAAAIGAALSEHSDVRKIAFTGSTGVGKLLMRQAADTVKKVSLELGGNAPFIVFDDADLDSAVAGALVCKFRNTGQTCVCANRIFVQSGIYEAFAAKLGEAVSAMVQGNGFDDGVSLGPLIEARAVDKVRSHVADALALGARVVVGGEALPERGPNWFAPTVLTGATAEMRVFREETFGPIAPLFRFEDEADVIRQANDTEYGLAAYFFANDLGRVWRVAEALEYGMVAVNEGVLSTEVAPFGGMKESGLGREGSKYGAEEFLEMKYLLLGGIGAP